MSPPPEVCNKSGQTAHYHIFNLSAEGFISLRQHLAAYRIRIYAYLPHSQNSSLKNDWSSRDKLKTKTLSINKEPQNSIRM